MRSMIKILKENEVECRIFSNDQGNSFLVVPPFGARILAVSVEGENLFWTHPDIHKGQGGQRTWISPEGGPKGFIFQPDWQGNRDFSMMDPGNFQRQQDERGKRLVLSNSFTTVSNDQKEHYNLTVTREMGLEEDPLQFESGFENLNYQYLGIDFAHKLRNNSKTPLDRLLALWCLIQVPPKGTMIVPVHEAEEGGGWRGNYFEPIPGDYVKSNPGSFSFYLHGSQRYKVGISPETAKGGICYLAKGTREDHFMVLMTFPVKPEARYVDKPKTEQESNGDAIQIYSHMEEGALAFGELECHSWGLQLQPDDEKAFPIKIYLYKAPLDVLKKIGATLVCSEFYEAYIFD
jgi:hypothetical protein